MFRSQIRRVIADGIQKRWGSDAPEFTVAPPENPEHGDYATNAALVLAKALGKNPMEVAEMLESGIRNQESWAIEIAAPGFINFRLSDSGLVRYLQDILDNPEQWGRSSEGGGKTVMVDYFQLNIAKRPHVGHLRSAVIGDAIKRMLLAQGYRAVSDTHVGDWGTQFGILLWAYKKADEDTKMKVEKDPFGQLENLYQEANEDPHVNEFGKREFAKLEQGDLENRKLWQWMVDISMRKLEESALRLGLLEFDEHKGESSYENDMPAIAEAALAKGVATKTKDGALVVDLTDEKLDQAVLVKSDGASTYLLRDLAAILYRKKRWDFWRNLYIVDVRQSHHFRQLFQVAERLGFGGVGGSEHISYGFMKLPEGMMSTRAGTAISLDAVLDEAIRRALEVIRKKNPDLENPDRTAETIGLGALKYFDLLHNRGSDIVFRWDDALSFEGNTGPYLQYTHARLKSILRKIDKTEVGNLGKVELDRLEHRLLATVLRFPEVIEDSLADFLPNTLADYLYKLASLANEFYHARPVTQEADEKKKMFRTELVSAVALTLKNGLGLLGISAPEKM